MTGNELPEGYEVVEVSDGFGGYEYVVQEVKEDFDWCNDSGYSDVFDYECCDDNHPCTCS